MLSIVHTSVEIKTKIDGHEPYVYPSMCHTVLVQVNFCDMLSSQIQRGNPYLLLNSAGYVGQKCVLT